MLNTILASKGKMSQSYVGDTRVPVTVLRAGPCVVTQIKTEPKDGYFAVQIGYGEKRLHNVTKPLQGHLKATIKDNKASRYLKEIRLDKEPENKIGDVITAADVLKPGDVVSVTATSKGKGFAGVVRRWNFAGGPKTHGQSNRHRSPGSIGQGTTPGRVWKGKKMGGRMGTDTVTVKNLYVIAVNMEKNEISLSGSIPGPKGGFVVVKRTKEGKLEELIEKPPEIQTKGKTGESGAKKEEA